MESGKDATSAVCREVRDALEAYSLDALDPAEWVAIEAHLQYCHACAEEAALIAEAATLLASRVPQVEPSPGLRARVLAAAVADGPRAEAQPGRAPSPNAPNGLSAARPLRRPDRGSTAPRRPIPALPRLRWLHAPLSAIAAAIAVASIAWAGTLQAQLSAQQAGFERLERRSERYDRIVSVLQSPELKLTELRGTPDAPEAEGRLMIDPSSESGMLIVRNLPPVHGERAYQLWYVSDSGRQSGGVVRPDEQGNGYFFVRVPRDLGPYRDVGITEEPAAGSEGPSGRRILRGAL